MRFFLILIVLLWMATPCLAAAKSASELRAILQTGASLIIDLDSHKYTASELALLASSLKGNATLTIKMGKGPGLPVGQCVQIANSRPGQVIFEF